jgi:acyl-CoA synthetase (AMP-forming)/AMP-acid ligase II
MQNTSNLQRQRGLTMISWICVLAIISFCGLFAFKVVPMYAENTYVVSALKSLANESDFEDMSDAAIKKYLNNFYMVNNVRSDGPQQIVIDRKSKKLIVKIDYESRANLMYNIDLVASFQNHLDAARKGVCCAPGKEEADE